MKDEIDKMIVNKAKNWRDIIKKFLYFENPKISCDLFVDVITFEYYEKNTHLFFCLLVLVVGLIMTFAFLKSQGLLSIETSSSSSSCPDEPYLAGVVNLTYGASTTPEQIQEELSKHGLSSAPNETILLAHSVKFTNVERQNFELWEASPAIDFCEVYDPPKGIYDGRCRLVDNTREHVEAVLDLMETLPIGDVHFDPEFRQQIDVPIGQEETLSTILEESGLFVWVAPERTVCGF